MTVTLLLEVQIADDPANFSTVSWRGIIQPFLGGLPRAGEAVQTLLARLTSAGADNPIRTRNPIQEIRDILVLNGIAIDEVSFEQAMTLCEAEAGEREAPPVKTD